jgi:hypothetical protein
MLRASIRRRPSRLPDLSRPAFTARSIVSREGAPAPARWYSLNLREALSPLRSVGIWNPHASSFEGDVGSCLSITNDKSDAVTLPLPKLGNSDVAAIDRVVEP